MKAVKHSRRLKDNTINPSGFCQNSNWIKKNCCIFAQEIQRGSSSVGRASASQAEGRGFEPRLPLKGVKCTNIKQLKVGNILKQTLKVGYSCIDLNKKTRTFAKFCEPFTCSILAPEQKSRIMHLLHLLQKKTKLWQRQNFSLTLARVKVLSL